MVAFHALARRLVLVDVVVDDDVSQCRQSSHENQLVPSADLGEEGGVLVEECQCVVKIVVVVDVVDGIAHEHDNYREIHGKLPHDIRQRDDHIDCIAKTPSIDRASSFLVVVDNLFSLSPDVN